ncbi:MAG TPA: T9SS type A sorting domain-containing protein [Rhodothermales bacterium]|nr:T9SS type A sorting domain-containing protein [Rhodothermales bacterium]
MTSLFRLGSLGFVCSLVFAGSVNGQSRVQHKVHHYDLSSATDKASKSQTMDPTFTAGAPLGLPRNGVSFQIDYNIWFVADNATENIDYFAFHAPSGWTITTIGAAPAQTACFGTPHDNVISGFSATSAYWGGDYGGGVVTVGAPGTYPDINNRSDCGPFDTATDSTSAHAAGLFHTFSVTMTPSAPDDCPGSTTGALPLCCSNLEVQAGADPPVGSEPYFNEMIAASDANAQVFGDGFYYVSLSCPQPFIALDKYPFAATIGVAECANQVPVPDTLTIASPPGGDAQFCYQTANLSSLFSDPWGHTACDTTAINDDVLGSVFDSVFVFQPGDIVTVVTDPVGAPAVGECEQNIAEAFCRGGEGSNYVLGEGILSGLPLRGASQPDSAWICTESSLPVEIAHFGAVADDRDLLLEWTTASETNNAGFAVEHRLADDPAFREVGFVDGAGTSTELLAYSFRIDDPGPGRHAVRLKQIDFDGAVTFSSVLLSEVEVPGDYYLTAAYPNPFTASATIEFAVPTLQNVKLELIDIQGRPVRTIFDGQLEANARRKATVDGSGLASGTYFLRMSGERFQTSEMVTIAK